MTSKINVGIIGCGKVADERHMPVLKNHKDMRVVAVADTNPANMHHIAEKYGIKNRFTHYAELLDQNEIDAVGILTPTGSHAEIGLAAMAANKHVFFEKPLALTVNECDSLISASKSFEKTVLLCFNLRWHRLIKRAKSFLQTGALGRIKAVHSIFSHERSGVDAPDWHRKLELGGGVSFNEAMHHFDLWRHLFDCDIKQICSFNTPSEYYEDETHISNAVLSNGALATGLFTFQSSPASEIDIFAERGRLRLSLYCFDGFEFFPRNVYAGDIKARLKKIITTLSEVPNAIPFFNGGSDFELTFNEIWQHFADCVNGNNTPFCNLNDGRQALAASLATMESVRSRKPVSSLPST